MSLMRIGAYTIWNIADICSISINDLDKNELMICTFSGEKFILDISELEEYEAKELFAKMVGEKPADLFGLIEYYKNREAPLF